MTFYVALCEDKHIDPVVRIFDTPEKAVGFAKQFIIENEWEQWYDDQIDEKIYDEETIYRCSYEQQGNVRVFPVELNDSSHDY